MSASLVGSEMCIRDRGLFHEVVPPPTAARRRRRDAMDHVYERRLQHSEGGPASPTSTTRADVCTSCSTLSSCVASK
eukprot:3490779-Alexandrium_andersonii.AAC.1